MTKQLPIDYTGAELKERGMKRAETHANQVHESWSDKAFQFLKDFAGTTKREFLAEDVREASKGIVPEPPSKRAWGGVVARAAFQGLIRRVGTKSVKNAKAHRCFASVWQSV